VLAISAAAAATASASAVTGSPSTVTNQLAASDAGIADITITPRASKSTSSVVITLNADVAGTYQILVTAAASTSVGYAAGLKSTSYTITTAGAPTALTLSSYAGKVISDTTANAAAGLTTAGQIFKLTMKDANGVATVLGLNESLSISDNSDATTDIRKIIGTTNGDALTTLGTANATNVSTDSSGTYYFRVTPVSGQTIVAGSGTVTVSGAGLLSSSLTTNATFTKVATTDAASTATIACTTTTLCPSGKVSGAAALTFSGLTGSTSADVIHGVRVTDKDGRVYTDSVTIASATTAATKATYSAPAPDASKTTVSVQLLGATTSGTSGVVTYTYELPAAAAIAVQGQATVLSATAGKNTFTVLVSDQYGTKIAFAPVTVAVSGRNTVATTSVGVTDSNGLISYSLTDAGTTGSKDTFTFTGGGTTATATVNYGTVTVEKVTVSGGSKAETVVGATLTAINGADNGPEASYVAIKAVVTDASGNLLSGVPVVFTVSTGAIVKTAAVDYATVYTGTDGAATSRVFNWLPGTQTVTATAGGKSSTDYLTWAATDATTARVLSATATGDIVTVKVVDRFGSGVKGVTVNLARTGTGLFGNGSSTQDVTTDKNGTADVRFSGNGTVEASLNTTTYAQAGDIAGQIAATAVTAAVAGTTKGTGASLAPAGVNKVTVAVAEGDNATLASAQAAADAAAEATDAANAATDAANAAAEAADSATAAAQDAADAVAALSTQVSEMVNALKKQITALTNLVIKIQKKVKA
jgi:adhesin/invasin